MDPVSFVWSRDLPLANPYTPVITGAVYLICCLAHNASLGPRKKPAVEKQRPWLTRFSVAHNAILIVFSSYVFVNVVFATKDYIAEHGLQYMLCPPVKRADGLPQVNGTLSFW